MARNRRKSSASNDPGDGQGVSKAQVLRDLGYGAVDISTADRVLQAAGLSNPRKERINPSKLDAVSDALAEHFIRACNRGDCQAEAADMVAQGDDRQVVLASVPDACDVCGGSVNGRAVQQMVDACQTRGWNRLCVVGGSPNARQTLEQLTADRLQLRLIDGTISRQAKRARDDTDWADAVAIWGSTQLAHKVSNLYHGPKVIPVARRSVRELCREIVKSAGMTY